VKKVSPVVENLGGKLERAFLGFGDYDVVAILYFPDDISAAALSMAMMAGGGMKNVKTTPLISWEDCVEAMKKAKKAAYKPPEENPMLGEDRHTVDYARTRAQFHTIENASDIYFFFDSLSSTLYFTILLTKSNGIGLFNGNWTDPFACLKGVNSSLKASIPEGVG